MSFALPLRGCGLYSALAGTMQWDLGSARVSRALVGVPPTSLGGNFQHPLVVPHEPLKPFAGRRGWRPRPSRSRSQSHRSSLVLSATFGGPGREAASRAICLDGAVTKHDK